MNPNFEIATRYLLTFLLNSLWQIPLVTLVAALANYAMHKGPALHRQILWVSALIASLLLPLISLRNVDTPAPPSATSLSTATLAPPVIHAPAAAVPTARAGVAALP